MSGSVSLIGAPHGKTEAPRPVFEAIAIFGESVPPAPAARPWSLENSRPSKFTARSVYAEQWLFHGPLFQAIAHMGKLSDKGIEGRLKVLPLEPLVKAGQPREFHTDLVVIDNFTQLLGAWGLDYLAEGDVMFPLHMEELEILGDRPPVGTEVACQITIHEIERHRIRVEAQFIRPDGTVWMRINDWEDWRFHWPGRYRDSFRQPRDYLVGEDLPIMDPGDGLPAGTKRSGSNRRPTWAGPSGATCWSSRSSGPTNAQHAWLRPAPNERRSQRSLGPNRSQGGGPASLERRRRSAGLSRRSGDPRRRPRPALLEPVGRARDDCACRLSRSLMPRASPSRWPRSIRRPGWASTSSRSSIGPPVFDTAAFTARRASSAGSVDRPQSVRVDRAVLVRQGSRGQGIGHGIGRYTGWRRSRRRRRRYGRHPCSARPRACWRPVPKEFTTNPLRVISARRGQRAWAWTIGKGIKP